MQHNGVWMMLELEWNMAEGCAGAVDSIHSKLIVRYACIFNMYGGIWTDFGTAIV